LYTSIDGHAARVAKGNYMPNLGVGSLGMHRPIFQDLSRRRWNGFLMFSGSVLATTSFLAAILWLSVAIEPAIVLLEAPLAQEMPEALHDGSMGGEQETAFAALPPQSSLDQYPAGAGSPATPEPPASPRAATTSAPMPVSSPSFQDLDPSVTAGSMFFLEVDRPVTAPNRQAGT
jgi:hypothetical protein